MEEWDVYDINHNLTGKTIYRGKDKLLPGEYHLAVDVWVINDFNQILIQKRSPYKKNYPNMWADSAGGAALKGEDSFQACIREIEEELGFVPDLEHLELRFSFVRHGNTLVDVYLLRQNLELNKLVLQPGEVNDVAWASFAEIKKLLQDGKFVPSVMRGLETVMEQRRMLPDTSEDEEEDD